MKNRLIETILTRRSCRNYLKKPVSAQDIKVILDCGLSAPSGMNKQPWFIVALNNAYNNVFRKKANERL